MMREGGWKLSLLVIAVYLLVSDCLAVRTLLRDNRLREQGVEVAGVVESLRLGHSGGRVPMTLYLVSYSFLASGGTFSGSGRITEAAYNALEVGSSLPVLYLPEDPTVNAARAVVDGDRIGGRYLLALHVLLPAMWAVLRLTYRRKSPSQLGG